MIIEKILAEIRAGKYLFSLETFSKYQDIVATASKYSPFTIYPDKSRSFDDLISVFGMATSDDSPFAFATGQFPDPSAGWRRTSLF
jgi:hypothetical protein